MSNVQLKTDFIEHEFTIHEHVKMLGYRRYDFHGTEYIEYAFDANCLPDYERRSLEFGPIVAEQYVCSVLCHIVQQQPLAQHVGIDDTNGDDDVFGSSYENGVFYMIIG